MNEFTIPKIYDGDGDLSKQWYVHYQYKHPETGKMQRFKVAISRRIKTRGARYERANEIKAELKKKLICGFSPFSYDSKKSTNVIDALDYALRFKAATVEKRTSHTYNSIVGMFIKWLKAKRLHTKTIEGITRNEAEKYADYLIVDSELSNRTFNNRLQALRSIFNLLIKKGYLETNPWNGVDYLRQREPEISAFTSKELKLIRDRLPIEHYQLWVVSQLIFYCYLRPAELVRLQTKDVLWDNQIILIPGYKSKNGKSQVVTIPDQLVENLKDWNREYPDHYYLFANYRELSPGIKQIAPTRISEAWRVFADKHGIKKNIYDMKHTGNGFASDLGLSLRDIQLQNRHHSLEQTQEYLDRFRKTPGIKFKEKFTGF